MLEKQIESQILTWLNYQSGVFAIKINSTGIFDPIRKTFRKNKNPFIHPGMSDIFGLCRGKFFVIEVKTVIRIRTVSDAQLRFMTKIREFGGYSLVATDLDQVIRFINSLKAL